MTSVLTYNASSLPQLVDSVNRDFLPFQKGYDAVMYKQSFVTKDAKPLHSGLSTIYAENVITDQYANQTPEGAPADTFPSQYGYEKAAYINPFKKMISISRLMRDGGKGNQIDQSIRSLIEAPMNRLELDLANRFTYFFSTAYTNKEGISVDVTMGDGLAGGSASHTVTGSASTWSNLITGNPAFSKSAMELGEQIAQRNTYDNLYKNIKFKSTHLVTTDDAVTCNQAKELFYATQNVNANGSGTFNVYSSSQANIQHVIVPRIALDSTGARSTTYEKYWFLIDDKLTSFMCTILNQPYVNTPISDPSGQDFATENWNFLSGMTYGIAIVSPRGIFVSKGDAS